jgi:predicted nucleic acid-binding protein
MTVGQGAATFARAMLKLCTRYDHPFAAADVAQVLVDFEAGTNDFNDGLLGETCRHNGWKLVTNDSDFTTGGIEILTSHPILLKACP